MLLQLSYLHITLILLSCNIQFYATLYVLHGLHPKLLTHSVTI